jgi:hypothetical protein
VEVTESVRARNRLLAIDIRLVELDQELRRQQLRVLQLEAELDDARLAGLVDEGAGPSAELSAELARCRQRLESQQALVESAKKNQWNARVQHALLRVKERRAEREAEAADQS